MMYRERRLLIPAEADKKITSLHNEFRAHNFGHLKTQSEFIIYLISLGAAKAESDLRRFIAPSIVLPG